MRTRRRQSRGPWRSRGGHGGHTSVIAFPEQPYSLAQSRAAFSGTPYTRSGSAVAGGKDMNDDGFDDVLIGAYTAMSPSLDFNSGKAYLMFSHL